MNEPVNIYLLETLPCSAKTAYEAWLNSEIHGAMINGSADIDPIVSGYFKIWDGAISGQTQQLDEDNMRITQSWRYNYDDWPEDKPSKLVIKFAPIDDNNTEMQLEHIGVPKKYAKDIEEGWKEHYLKPMKAYFSR